MWNDIYAECISIDETIKRMKQLNLFMQYDIQYTCILKYHVQLVIMLLIINTKDKNKVRLLGMNKTLKELNLEDDFLFAKVMSDKEICRELLEKILEIKIEKVEMIEEQKTIDLLLESKGIRLDVYVKDENNTIYNVEMQRGKHKSLPKRLRYYQGSIDLDLISKGEDYRKLTKSYIIFICTFDLFHKGRHKYTFQNVCLEDNSVILNDEAQKIILNTKGFMKDLSEELLLSLIHI
eukprot:TRINITY_DN6331_c0_g1_i3.p2 TRINITY_DN6331_c0_g1~~TRINITY_DN6331_c0_g1_i3.p2  ORF type:complete len:236 (+),score=32.99 TRINITY_DN6331_c0_g1_i3:161-868(+)